MDELVASLEVLLASNAENDSTASSINQLGLGFAGNLDTEKVVALGHSFGGATVLTMLARRPGLIKAVVAHEPAVDWMPDYGRRFLFPFEKMKRTAAKYSGGTGGYESSGDEGSSLDGKEKSKLFLFSKSWYDQVSVRTTYYGIFDDSAQVDTEARIVYKNLQQLI